MSNQEINNERKTPYHPNCLCNGCFSQRNSATTSRAQATEQAGSPGTSSQGTDQDLYAQIRRRFERTR